MGALYSTQEGTNAAVKALLEGGVDVHVLDMNGDTALHVAARENRLKAATLLLKHGASVTSADKDGATPLHAAVAEGRVKVRTPIRRHLLPPSMALSSKKG